MKLSKHKSITKQLQIYPHKTTDQAKLQQHVEGFCNCAMTANIETILGKLYF